MGSFDKSFYDILNRYKSIKEQTAVYDKSGQYMGEISDDGKFQAITKGNAPAPGAADVDNFQAVTAPSSSSPSTAAPASNPPPPASKTPASSPSPEDVKQQGQTGAEIKTTSGGQFASVQDRTNQAKVDAVLGKGKFKAGTAEANLALADYYRKNPVSANPLNAGKPGQPTSAALASQAGQPANITPSEFDARRAAQTGTARPNSAASATPAQATGVPAGTTPQQFDTRRAAQTGSSAPTTTSPTTQTAAPSRPKNRADAATAARNRTAQPKPA